MSSTRLEIREDPKVAALLPPIRPLPSDSAFNELLRCQSCHYRVLQNGSHSSKTCPAEQDKRTIVVPPYTALESMKSSTSDSAKVANHSANATSGFAFDASQTILSDAAAL